MIEAAVALFSHPFPLFILAIFVMLGVIAWSWDRNEK